MPALLQFDSLEKTVLAPRPLHLAIGMFDGVHLGHRAVVDAAIQSAHRSAGLAAVLTFSPHPSRIFRPDNPTRLIMGAELKARMLGAAGIHAVITQRFTPEFAQIESEQFLPHLKRCLPRLHTLYVGSNWRFGRGRRGDIALLLAQARKHGLTVVSAERIQQDGEPISSTRIRGCLENGGMEEANRMLGYTYFAEGAVAEGKRLGRTLGFPTLNLDWEPELQPRHGVYAVRVSGADGGADGGAACDGVANYGLRPTVEQSVRPRLEAHVLGECPFGAGDAIRVEWLRFLRPEKKFGGVGELTAQIAADRRAAAEFFAAESQ